MFYSFIVVSNDLEQKILISHSNLLHLKARAKPFKGRGLRSPRDPS